MLKMQCGHRDVNNAGWTLRCKQCRVATEMLTMQGGHIDVNNAGWPQMLTMQGGH